MRMLEGSDLPSPRFGHSARRFLSKNLIQNLKNPKLATQQTIRIKLYVCELLKGYLFSLNFINKGG